MRSHRIVHSQSDYPILKCVLLAVGLLLTAVVILTYPNRSLAAAGDIDPTFNAGGAGANDTVSSLALQPDGKLLIVGAFTSYNGDATVSRRIMRLNTDGTRDATFNIGGLGADSSVSEVKVQPDGKIIIGGGFTAYNGDLSVPARIMRLNSDGTRDLTFNAGGSGADAHVNAIALQSDGKIIIGGSFTSYNGDASAPDRVLRLNADGTRDITFNPGGAGIRQDNGSAAIYALRLQVDGKILVGGYFFAYNGDAATPDMIMRLNVDGTRDTSFNAGGGGATYSDLTGILGGAVVAIALVANGKIVIGGSFNGYSLNGSQTGVMRLNADGTVDSTFNVGGSGVGFREGVSAIAADADGRLLISGGFTKYNGDLTIPRGIIRLNADGTRDLTFNPGGTGAQGIGPIALQTDGKIVVGGSYTSYNGDASAPDKIMRLLQGSSNAAPTLTPAGSVTRQQGTALSNSQIATTSDPESGAGLVAVSLTSANPANGVTVSNIVNTNGTVTADVVANCAATNASFSLAATDGNGATTAATLNVTVTANAAPTLVYSTPQSVAFAGSLNVVPTTATDNGSVTYSVLTVTPSLTTVPTAGSTGVVAITNARPAGTHLITIRATDNCGTTTDASFNLNVSIAGTTTVVSPSINPSNLAESVTFTATVSGPSGTGTPTGTVQFKDGGANLGSAISLSATGTAQLTTASLNAGTHAITADYSGDTNFGNSSGSLAGGQVVNNRPVISFTASNYNVNESDGVVHVVISRTGDTAPAVSFDYATDDFGAPAKCDALNSVLASSRCDFTSIFGSSTFAATETQKTLDIPINQDSYAEGPEMFKISLSNLSGTAGFATPSSATVTVNDSAAPATNAIDDTATFVRQQYRDFLNRDADPAGLAFWKDNIDQCKAPGGSAGFGSVAACVEVMRINTSAAFFLSIEFRQTGQFVRDFYVASLNRPATNNMPNFVEFERDTQAVQRGVVVGQGAWQTILNNNRDAFMRDFVMRAEFVGLYPTTNSPALYVDQLYLHAAINPVPPQERLAAIAEFSSATTAADPGARGRALLRITQNAAFQQREVNRAFAQMQYFGYLRRNPNDAPDSNFDGYYFWLDKLTQFNGNFVQAEMVKAFISSNEYRARFGP